MGDCPSHRAAPTPTGISLHHTKHNIMPKNFSHLLHAAALLAALAVSQIPAALNAQSTYVDSIEVREADMGVERVATNFLPPYIAMAANDNETRWVQIDLGRSIDIEAIKILPPSQVWGQASFGFPTRFSISVSDDADFKTYKMYEDQSGIDEFPDPHHRVLTFSGVRVKGRYVRFTATHLRMQRLVLTRILVFSGGKDVAEGCKVTDSNPSPAYDPNRLTRPLRPDGEYVVTDNPGNVIPANQWHPAVIKARVPMSGVTLKGGLFERVMDNNVGYLLHSFTYEEIVRNFKLKAGLPVAPFNPKFDFMWLRQLPGSSAGRFLMGAGNTLRWKSVPALRDEMNAIVNLIDSCKEPDGYLLAFPKHLMFEGERGAYCRSWVTQGLIEAGYGGNRKAFSLLKDFSRWFNHSPFLPEMLKRCKQGIQGMVPLTLTFFTPVGTPDDIYTAQRYFQLNHWMQDLAAHRPEAIYQFPYDRPHNYLVTALEPYMDLYMATGDKRYLDAAQGGYNLFRDNWEHIGGSLAIEEGEFVYEPKSYWLTKSTGELCGNAFWVRLSERFHKLFPDEEKYVAEMEKSIYNVIIPNQNGSQGIRYFAHLTGHKMKAEMMNTCCEGQGTRIFGSLPEYIYNVSDDGLWVNLFASSVINCKVGNYRQSIAMQTDYPYATGVVLRVLTNEAPQPTALHVRMPYWASSEVEVRVNGKPYAKGKPGTFLTLKRLWKKGDKVSFVLPATLTATKYTGVEPGFGNNHYGLMYAGIMLAAVNHSGKEEFQLKIPASNPASALVPVKGRPLHYRIEGNNDIELMPYFEVNDEAFTCFPALTE